MWLDQDIMKQHVFKESTVCIFLSLAKDITMELTEIVVIV